MVARFVPGAHVVKAFNHLPPSVLTSEPTYESGKRILSFATEDDPAGDEVAVLISRRGVLAIDFGPRAEGDKLIQFPGGPLTARNFAAFD
jgi:8-hydroxy-5-deazaflavin:NADPH oxidoreductase